MGCVSTKGQHHISLSLSVPDSFLIAGFVALALILDNIDWYSIKVQAQTFEAYASVRMIQHSLGFRLTKKKKKSVPSSLKPVSIGGPSLIMGILSLRS